MLSPPEEPLRRGLHRGAGDELLRRDARGRATPAGGNLLEYPLSSTVREDLGDATELVLGIRPEDVELLESGGSVHDFPVEVDVVEPMGNENNLLATFAGTDLSINAITEGMRLVRDGERYAARLPESAIHLFDRSSGQALHNRQIEDEEELLEPRV
ncbi:TOBE domain-containing protein [Saliphagus sp. GCM10025308]